MDLLREKKLEALSLEYVESYLNCTEQLPAELQMHLNRLRELDIVYANYMEKLTALVDNFAMAAGDDDKGESNAKNPAQREMNISPVAMLTSVQDMFKDLNIHDIESERLHISQQIHDIVENMTGRVELKKTELEEFNKEQDQQQHASSSGKNQEGDFGTKRRRRGILYEDYVPLSLRHCALSSLGSAHEIRKPCLGPCPIHYPRSVVVNGSRTPSPTLTATQSPAPKELEATASTSSAEMGRNLRYSTKNSSRNYTGVAISGIIPGTPARRRRHSSATSMKTSEGFKVDKTIRKKDIQRKRKDTGNKNKKSVHDDSDPEGEADADIADPEGNADVAVADPDEPTYCLCNKISYGEMVCCDNELCPVEWFHFGCVQLKQTPHGVWYCPRCRDGRPNVMKKRSILIEELEIYNKEREQDF